MPVGSAAPSSPDTPATVLQRGWGTGESRGSQQASPPAAQGLLLPSGLTPLTLPFPGGAPSEGAPALGPCDALSALLSVGAVEGAALLGSVATAGGRAALTGSSPALGAIMCPPSCQPSFHLLKCILKCKSSPVVLLPTALPRSHGFQLQGRRLNSSAHVPAAPLHPAASASAWPPLLQLPPASSISGVGSVG